MREEVLAEAALQLQAGSPRADLGKSSAGSEPSQLLPCHCQPVQLSFRQVKFSRFLCFMFSHAFSSEMACCEESVPQLLVGELALAQGRWVTFLLAFYVQFFLQFSSKTHRWVWAQPSTSPQPTFSPHLDLLLLLLASPCWRQILILTTRIKINLYERFQGFQGKYF